MIGYPNTSEENDFLKAWIAKRIPEYEPGDDAMCLGVVKNGKLLAVCAYNNWKRTDIEVSFAAEHPRWASKGTITGLLSYPFYQLETNRVTALILKSNKRARRFVQGIGFEQEGRLRWAGPNKEAIIVYGLTKGDYLKRYGYGIEEPARAATGT